MGCLQFVLVADAGQARRVKRCLAEAGFSGGWIVGTWARLLDFAGAQYRLSRGEAEVTRSLFSQTLRELSDAFWARSLAVAPESTEAVVERALTDLLTALEPLAPWPTGPFTALPERIGQQLEDLLRLARILDDQLPASLGVVRQLLQTDRSVALRTVRVHSVQPLPLNRWQTVLITKLNQDAADEALVGITVDTTSAVFSNSVDASAQISPQDATKIAMQGGNQALPMHCYLLGASAQTFSTPSTSRALIQLQTGLFRTAVPPVVLDESVQWVGVRDFLQEAEISTGMVQRLLETHPDWSPADIGVLLPEHPEYARALRATLNRAGLTASGLPNDCERRDLGTEVVHHFLYCREGNAPAMARAVCLSSPLMPWSAAEGARMAQQVSDGCVHLSPTPEMSAAARSMLGLLHGSDQQPASLIEALHAFRGCLTSRPAGVLWVHQASAAVDILLAALEDSESLNWVGLRRLVPATRLIVGNGQEFNREGITIWLEGQEPWRSVQYLLVLGFGYGHYPLALSTDSILTEVDRGLIRQQPGWHLPTPSEVLTQRRERLVRQLNATRTGVTFLIPRRGVLGEKLAPSASLVFMHSLFAGPPGIAPESRVLDVEASDQRIAIAHLAPEPGLPMVPARTLEVSRLRFAHDLLQLPSHAHRQPDDRKPSDRQIDDYQPGDYQIDDYQADDYQTGDQQPSARQLADRQFSDRQFSDRQHSAGKPKPQSPSSLEILMVSPLAWLLRELRAEPLGWTPEAADGRLLGTLAHAVFETLFSGTSPFPGPTTPDPSVPDPSSSSPTTPDPTTLKSEVDRLVTEVLKERAPFLLNPAWQMERRRFSTDLCRAARAWYGVLSALNADVLGTEVPLFGDWDGLPVQGRADLLLGLPDGRVLVVDYKRESSERRRKRMERGYDFQAWFYRNMLQTGGVEGVVAGPLRNRLNQCRDIGTVYFMLRDQVALADQALPGTAAIPGWQALAGPLSEGALSALTARVESLRAGLLELNRSSDKTAFERSTGITPYALENSPLIALFSVPDTEETTP